MVAYQDLLAVREVSVDLRAGRVTALIGPNGSGKSTLLRALARLRRPVSGEVTVDDQPVGPMSGREFARMVTLLSQHRPTPGGVSVRDVVGYGRHPHRTGWRGEDPRGSVAVDQAMALTGVADMADRGVDELSGGELQRVWLASALAQDTSVLLLDEPTNHLDLRYQVEILDVIRELADDHGVAVGVVLHDLDSAAVIADEVVLLRDGRLLAAGPPKDVLTSENLSQAYGVTVRVVEDPVTGTIHCRPIGRRTARTG